jgi:hypothetical protein
MVVVPIGLVLRQVLSGKYIDSVLPRFERRAETLSLQIKDDNALALDGDFQVGFSCQFSA